MPLGIQFTSLFTADIFDPSVYQRGDIPIHKLASGSDTLIIRLEDVLLDTAYNAYRKAAGGSAHGLQLYNQLYRMQKKPGDLVNDAGIIVSIPVFYPLFRFLAGLKALEYPVKLLHDSPCVIRHHPLIQHFDSFDLITPDRLDAAALKGHVLSAYESDHPDYLFPRSFNRGVMDVRYTVRIDQV